MSAACGADEPRLVSRRPTPQWQPIARCRCAGHRRGPQLGVPGRPAAAAGGPAVPRQRCRTAARTPRVARVRPETASALSKAVSFCRKASRAPPGSTPIRCSSARDWGPGTMTASGYPFVLKRLAARHAARDGRGDVSRHRRRCQRARHGLARPRRGGARHPRDPRRQFLSKANSFCSARRRRSGCRCRRNRASAALSPASWCFRSKRTGIWDGTPSRRRAGVARPRRLPRGCRCRRCAAGLCAGAARVDRERRATRIAGCWSRSTATCRAAPSPSASRTARWLATPLPLPDNASIHRRRANDRDDRAFIDVAGLSARPNTLYLADAAAGTATPVKSLPAALRRLRLHRRAVRGDLERRHDDPLFRGAPEERCRWTARRRPCSTAMAGSRCR